jgi:hypothetical protein
LPRLEWRVALKAFAGFLVGLTMWALLSPMYDGMVAKAAQFTLRAFERPPVTRLRMAADHYVTVDRSDFDPRSKRPAIAIRDLTFNFILLVALFAAGRRVFSDRNIGGFLVAAGLLALTHVLGAVTEVMSLYVLKLGLWSEVHYSSIERNVWSVANHFYRLVLMYAIAFGLWWMFRDSGASASAAIPAKKRKRR